MPKRASLPAYPNVVTCHDDERARWVTTSDPRQAPSANTRDLVLNVPPDTDERERFLARHELGHVRFTDRTATATNGRNCAEDWRVSYHLARLFPDFDATRRQVQWGTKSAADRITMHQQGKMPASEIVSHAVAGWPSKESEQMLAAADVPDYVRHQIRELLKPYTPRSHKREWETQDTAELLGRILDALEEPQTGDESDEDTELPEDKRPEPKPQSGSYEWAPLRVYRPDLTVRAKLPYALKPGELGAFRYPHRVLSDAQCFGQRRRSPQAGVLVDVSGSMSLSTQDIDRILSETPAALIAMYSSSVERQTDDKHKGQYYGQLSVISRAGQRVPSVSRVQDTHHTPLNICDGPALQWLIDHGPRPLFWLSDARVTVPIVNGQYVRDDLHVGARVECEMLCWRHRVRRVENLDQLIKAIRDSR